jgi:hypothetical protein
MAQAVFSCSLPENRFAQRIVVSRRLGRCEDQIPVNMASRRQGISPTTSVLAKKVVLSSSWRMMNVFFGSVSGLSLTRAASSTEFANFPAAAGDGVDEDVERFHLLSEASGVADAGSADAGRVSAWRGVALARVRSNSGDKPTSKSNLYFNSDRKKQ